MWQFLEDSPAIGITVSNPLLDPSGERSEPMVAVIDTGFSGFLFVPEGVFERLGFSELRASSRTGRLVEGSSLKLRAAFGRIQIQEVDLSLDGEVYTCRGAEETLVGMAGLRDLAVTLDSCQKRSSVRVC